MERYIIFIPADGPCRLVACDDGDSIKLETLQELVDGPIEVTPSCLGITWAREPVDGIDLMLTVKTLSLFKLATTPILYQEEFQSPCITRAKKYTQPVRLLIYRGFTIR